MIVREVGNDLKANPILQPWGAHFDSSRSPLLAEECVGYDERRCCSIERFIEVYHAAHSAPAPVLLLAIEVFASGRSSTHCVHQMVVNLVLVRPSEGHSLNSTLHHQCHCRHPQVI